MEANPFSTTLCIAIKRPNMTLEDYKRMKEELHAQGLTLQEKIFDAMLGYAEIRDRCGGDPYRYGAV